jgi:serine phosphatase RsbU (regulator of sigma subunit)
MLSQSRVSPQPELSPFHSVERAHAANVAHRRRSEGTTAVTRLPLWAWLFNVPSWPAPVAVAVCTLLQVLVVLLDVATGSEIQFSLFYFLPIIVVSLRFDARGALAVALIGAALARLASLDRPAPLNVLVTNTITEALVFTFVALVTGALQRQGERLQAQRQELEVAHYWLQEDLRAAELLQRYLLRRPLPVVVGVEMATELKFARGVGGDFYDLRQGAPPVSEMGSGPPRLAICVADVSGKGAKAALVSATLRGLLDEAAGEPADPAAFLRHLNARLYDALPGEMFVTMFYGCLDPGTGELRYASAGHDPPLLCRGERVEELLPTAPLLCMLPDLPARTERVCLQPDQTLLLYTDGLTTARCPEGGRVGEERVSGWLQERQAHAPARLVGEILELACPAAAGAPEDDIVLIALRRHSA